MHMVRGQINLQCALNAFWSAVIDPVHLMTGTMVARALHTQLIDELIDSEVACFQLAAEDSSSRCHIGIRQTLPYIGGYSCHVQIALTCQCISFSLEHNACTRSDGSFSSDDPRLTCAGSLKGCHNCLPVLLRGAGRRTGLNARTKESAIHNASRPKKGTCIALQHRLKLCNLCEAVSTCRALACMPRVKKWAAARTMCWTQKAHPCRIR